MTISFGGALTERKQVPRKEQAQYKCIAVIKYLLMTSHIIYIFSPNILCSKIALCLNLYLQFCTFTKNVVKHKTNSKPCNELHC